MHCSNCGHLIATDDKFCTGCGRPIAVIPVKKKKTHPLVLLLAVVLFLGVLGAIINAVTQSSVSDPPSRTEDGERTARAATGAVMLKRAMRNPDSFRLSSALVMSTGSVCYAYRAQNGFGGFNAGHAVLTSTGKFKTEESDGFTTLWNKECAQKTGQETVDGVNVILEHPYLLQK